MEVNCQENEEISPVSKKIVPTFSSRNKNVQSNVLKKAKKIPKTVPKEESAGSTNISKVPTKDDMLNVTVQKLPGSVDNANIVNPINEISRHSTEEGIIDTLVTNTVKQCSETPAVDLKENKLDGHEEVSCKIELDNDISSKSEPLTCDLMERSEVINKSHPMGTNHDEGPQNNNSVLQNNVDTDSFKDIVCKPKEKVATVESLPELLCSETLALDLETINPPKSEVDSALPETLEQSSTYMVDQHSKDSVAALIPNQINNSSEIVQSESSLQGLHTDRSVHICYGIIEDKQSLRNNSKAVAGNIQGHGVSSTEQKVNFNAVKDVKTASDCCNDSIVETVISTESTSQLDLKTEVPACLSNTLEDIHCNPNNKQITESNINEVVAVQDIVQLKSQVENSVSESSKETPSQSNTCLSKAASVHGNIEDQLTSSSECNLVRQRQAVLVEISTVKPMLEGRDIVCEASETTTQPIFHLPQTSSLNGVTSQLKDGTLSEVDDADLTDSQLCATELSVSEQIPSDWKSSQQLDIFPLKRYKEAEADGTKIINELIGELSRFNKFLLRSKREMESAWKQNKRTIQMTQQNPTKKRGSIQTFLGKF